MREYEREIKAEFKKFANVAEAWPLYDSVVICNQLLGSEANVPGWFTTFAAFGARERHSFFKNRSAGIAGDQYCNMQNGDSMDFAFLADSIGIEITGPPTYDVQWGAVDGNGQLDATMDHILPQWWAADFPWHCGLQLKIQQDIRWEGPVMSAPAGVGASASGLGFQQNAVSTFGEAPWLFSQTTQGQPSLKNRQPFPEPIGIPRTGSVEAILHVGEWARTGLTNITGPHEMFFHYTAPTHYYSRYLIRVSLFGKRLVQQRAQYHR